MIIENSKPQTFFCTEENITVFDGCGKVFYFHPNKKNSLVFSLPQGIYYTENNLTGLGKHILPTLKKLPSPEKDIEVPQDFNMHFGFNPHKASIDLEGGNVMFDYCFLNLPRFCLVHAIYHEKAHYKYNTEEFCDFYADNEMLKRGYNQSQCVLASIILSHNDKRHDANLAFVTP